MKPGIKSSNSLFELFDGALEMLAVPFDMFIGCVLGKGSEVFVGGG